MTVTQKVLLYLDLEVKIRLAERLLKEIPRGVTGGLGA